MRDDRMKWATLPEAFLPAVRESASVRPCTVGRQYLVSSSTTGAHKDAAGWPDITTNETYAVRIARDQSLQIGGAARPTGWRAEVRQAVSDMSDGYQVFEVTGAQSFDVLCRGAELDLTLPSMSVARQLWGMQVLLYRHTDDDTFRLHVERSFGMALYDALVAAVDQADRD